LGQGFLVQGGIHWQNNLGQSSLIAVAYDSWKQRGPAVELARELGLPLVNGPAACQYAFLLAFTEERLELREQGTRVPGPVYVDFLGGASAYRRCHGGGRSQALARAVGLKRGATPDVLDATAGLGRDAFTLACLGCRVCLVERSPVIASLLRYGLETAKRDPVLGPLVQERMVLQVNDSIAFMSRVSDRPRPEVVYLDPMHPRRAKAALVKKEMRALRRIVGEDQDAPDLLDAALKHALRRVVVKRPNRASVLEGPKPSVQIAAGLTRFDVYLLI
jgi:16S rRNA (guanine1516-N2)-methyltransferase